MELTFENVLGIYNALWSLGGTIVNNPAYGDHDNWLLTYRRGLRGMLSRILAVDRHFVLLNRYQQQAEIQPQHNPNEYVIECDYHAGIILFGMDSSLECFVFAINALGFAKAPDKFCNITEMKQLKTIRPQNILGGDPKDKWNPRPGYQMYFPQLVALWKKNESLIKTIFEYHDVSKHRTAVSTGGNFGTLRMIDDPKQSGVLKSSTSLTLQSLAIEYQKFMDALLPIALEEGGSAFGFTVTKKTS